MKHYKGWKILTLKYYFDKGYGVTSYIKYFIAFFGLASQDVKTTLLVGFLYGLSCFVVGWAWDKYKLNHTEAEISNRRNPFVKEMRYSVKRKIFK